MNLNDLSNEEIKGLLNVEKVLNALLDKINNVESQITHNREQIDNLTKTVNELSNKVMSIEISTNNELKQLKNDNIPINQKLFNIEKHLGNYSKDLLDIKESLDKLMPEDEEEDNKKKKPSINTSVKDLKKLKKK